MGKLLTKMDVLKKDVLKREKVEFAGGDYVFVRQMTGTERDMWEQSVMERGAPDENGNIETIPKFDHFRAKLAVCTMCDDDGNLVLTMDDVVLLSDNMSAERLERIAEKAMELNRIRGEDRKALTKNLKSGQNEGSISGSV